MLSKSSSFCFFSPLGGTDLTAEVRNKGQITSPNLLLQMESLRTSHWASVSYLLGIIFCTRTLLRVGNGEQSDKITGLRDAGLPTSLGNNWWQQGNVVLPLGKHKGKNKLCHSHYNRLNKSSYDQFSHNKKTVFIKMFRTNKVMILMGWVV